MKHVVSKGRLSRGIGSTIALFYMRKIDIEVSLAQKYAIVHCKQLSLSSEPTRGKPLAGSEATLPSGLSNLLNRVNFLYLRVASVACEHFNFAIETLGLA